MNKPEVKLGFLQAFGVVAYCTLVGSFMWNINKIMPGPDRFTTPILALTLFCTSALICALIVGYKPYQLFFLGKKKEAINTVLSTAGFLFTFLILFFVTIFLTK